MPFDSPSIDRKPLKPAPEVRMEDMKGPDFFWHATLSGADGVIVDGIVSKGLLPKDAIGDLPTGNDGTMKTHHAYVTDTPSGAAVYLKRAQGFITEKAAGLPVFVCVKVTEKNTDYSYDDDMARGVIDQEDIETNNRAWFAYLLTYKTVDEFIQDKNTPAFSMKELQKRLAVLSGRTMLEAKQEIWEMLNAEGSSASFVEGSRLEKLLQKIDPNRWHKFLTYLNRTTRDKFGFEKNLSRKGGWQPEEVKRVFVMSPNGDPDWRKWAKLIPPNICTRWDNWDALQDIHGNPLPGKGKLVRIK